MRYFKYKGPKSTESIALRAQYAKYSKQEKKLARKAKFWKFIAVVLLLTFLSGSFLFRKIFSGQFYVTSEFSFWELLDFSLAS